MEIHRVIVHSLDALQAIDQSGHNARVELGDEELHELGSVVGEKCAQMSEYGVTMSEEIVEVAIHKIVDHGQPVTWRRPRAEQLKLQERLVHLTLVALLGDDRIVN